MPAMAQVTIYTTDWCGYCRSAKRFLAERGVEVTEIDLTGDDEGRQKLVERSGRTTVPQIWIGDVHVGGYDDLRALDRAGKLEPLLKA
jgi:glutaredoxin 3